MQFFDEDAALHRAIQCLRVGDITVPCEVGGTYAGHFTHGFVSVSSACRAGFATGIAIVKEGREAAAIDNRFFLARRAFAVEAVGH